MKKEYRHYIMDSTPEEDSEEGLFTPYVRKNDGFTSSLEYAINFKSVKKAHTYAHKIGFSNGEYEVHGIYKENKPLNE